MFKQPPPPPSSHLAVSTPPTNATTTPIAPLPKTHLPPIHGHTHCHTLPQPPTPNHGPTRDHARADSTVLGRYYQGPRPVMARAHVGALSSSITTTTTTTSTTTTGTTTTAHSISVPSQPSSWTISSPVGAPFYPKADDYAGFKLFSRVPERMSARMPLELSIVPRAHWLSRVRSCLRLLIIVLSGAVVCTLVHTIQIYRGNRYLDLRHGELPLTWPARTNLAPTIILIAIAAANFLASVAIVSLSLKRSFRRPIRSRDMYRIVAGSFGVILWSTALVVFHLLGNASKASLGRYSCINQNIISNGWYQYRAVCKEQSVAFYLAIGAASAELFTLITLAISAILSAKNQPHLPTIQIHDKKHFISYASKPKKPRIP